ncbi:hypothetical protein GCM10022228_02530 [Halomonas cibimaris]|uniref:Uncharacterized protein n=1 Tax=Halomonas cibimaris TaxID=657012 RepID=A0ABP7L826_9GAMM
MPAKGEDGVPGNYRYGCAGKKRQGYKKTGPDRAGFRDANSCFLAVCIVRCLSEPKSLQRRFRLQRTVQDIKLVGV